MNQKTGRSNVIVIILGLFALFFFLVIGTGILGFLGLFAFYRTTSHDEIENHAKAMTGQSMVWEERLPTVEHRVLGEITNDQMTADDAEEMTVIDFEIDESGVLRIDNRAVDAASLRQRIENPAQCQVNLHVDGECGAEELRSLLAYFDEIEVTDVQVITRK